MRKTWCSVINKFYEFCNVVDTYEPELLTGYNKNINDTEIWRIGYKFIEGAGSKGMGVFFSIIIALNSNIVWSGVNEELNSEFK